jgi:hypothetical protein
MARHSESKPVRGQIEARRAARPPRQSRSSTTYSTEVELLRKREHLLLSRTRVLNDLESTQNPRYKTMLSAALTHLDEELARLPALGFVPA